MSAPVAPPLAEAPTAAIRSLGTALAVYRHGRADPTTRSAPGRSGPGWFARCTLTPDGPATLLVRWSSDTSTVPDADAWGPGRDWVLDRVREMVGDLDQPPPLPTSSPAVTRLAVMHRGLRIGASRNLYHELLPTVIEQRITAVEAKQQWRRLCLELGETPPGPPDLLAGSLAGMRLPPAPETLARRPSWWFHPLGIEAKRARALRSVARHADRLWSWALGAPGVAAERLGHLDGIGPWTIGSVLGPALGDPDAVAVGDYHLPHLVAWNLASQPRADDARMLALLDPFAGQRGRVVRLLTLGGRRPPAFGARRRILPVHRW